MPSLAFDDLRARGVGRHEAALRVAELHAAAMGAHELHKQIAERKRWGR